jgi:hypothetical protein
MWQQALRSRLLWRKVRFVIGSFRPGSFVLSVCTIRNLSSEYCHTGVFSNLSVTSPENIFPSEEDSPAFTVGDTPRLKSFNIRRSLKVMTEAWRHLLLRGQQPFKYIPDPYRNHALVVKHRLDDSNECRCADAGECTSCYQCRIGLLLTGCNMDGKNYFSYF